MPSVNVVVPNEASDVYGDASGAYATTGSLGVGSVNSGTSDIQTALYFPLTSAIPRYNVASNWLLNIYLAGASANALTIEVHLIKALGPNVPGTSAAISGATRTTAKTEYVMTGAAAGWVAFDFTAQLNEILQTGQVSSIVVLLRDKVRSFVNNNRAQFRPWGYGGGFQPYITGSYDAPPARTGSVTKTIPVPTRVRTGSFPTTTTGSVVRSIAAPTRVRSGQAGTPPEVTGRTARTIPAPTRSVRGGQGDPTKHTLFSVEPPNVDTHYLVTEDGSVLGFSAAYGTTLGGVRDAMIGNADNAWFPESGVRTRTTSPLAFTALLGLRDEPKRDGDVLERRLHEIREIHHPDGRVLDVWDVLLKNRAADDRLELSARPTGAFMRDLLLSGVRTAAFDTRDSTPELPVFGIDAAGGIIAPLRARRVDRGSLALAVKLDERGILPLASVGRPIEGDGTSDPTSITLSYQGAYLHVSVRGVLTRVREGSFGTFAEELALRLYWTAFRAYLVTCSALGERVFEVGAGAPVDLSERIVTAGVDANGVGLGAFLSPGSSSLGGKTGVPFFALRVPSQQEARRGVVSLHREFSRSDRDWSIVPPDYALEISRLDTKAFELAPGESQTFDFSVRRVGGYTGTVDFDPRATGLNASYSVLSTVGDTITYRVTVSAPSGSAEGSYPFHIDAKATGADNPGSALADVRTALDALLEVAASPVIAPNPTYVLTANDPVQKRPATILADTSGQGNTFNFRGYARVARLGRSFLTAGKESAAVESAALVNTAQAHRMNGDQTHAMILREVEKAAVGRVLFHAGADASADGPQIVRVEGGLGLRTVIGGTVANSPDTLAIPSGFPAVAIRVTATEVLLTTRNDMRSVRLSRPAWSDAAVRAVWGAARGGGGAFSNLGRTHVVTAVGHPYALTDIQLRRTIDALQANVPTLDGKPEYADALFVLSQFNNVTAEQPNEKRRNYAAPALGPEWEAIGSVTYPSGAVQVPGSQGNLYTTRFVTFTDGDFEVVVVLNNLSQSANYDYHFAVAALEEYNGYFGVGKNYTGNPLLRVLLNDGNYLQKELTGSAKTGKLVLRFTVTGQMRYVQMGDLATGKSLDKPLDRGASATGKKSFSWGGVYAAGSGSTPAEREANWRHRFEGTATGMEVLVHKGLFNAQEVTDLKTLLL